MIIIFLPYFQKNVKAIFTHRADVYVLQGIEGWLAEQVETGSDAPVDTLVVHELSKQLNNSFAGIVYGNTMNQRSMVLHNGALLQQALKPSKKLYQKSTRKGTYWITLPEHF